MGRRSPLVGRSAERGELDAALARCRDGSGGLLLVSGDPGAGKSRLVDETLTDWDGCVLRSAATAAPAPTRRLGASGVRGKPAIRS